jgi:hypothetical protein
MKFEIRVNDFRDLLDERDDQNVQRFHAIKEARRVMKIVAIRFPGAEGAISLTRSLEEKCC